MQASQSLPEVTLDSQRLVQELNGVDRNPIDVSQMPVGVLFADGWENRVHCQNRENSDSDDGMTEPAHNTAQPKKTNPDSNLVEGINCQALVTSSKPRNRFRFSNRSLFGRCDLFLLDEFCNDWPPPTVPEDHTLLGRVRQCPSRRNGNVFHVSWNTTQDGKEVNQLWIRNVYPNTVEYKSKLQAGIEEFEATKAAIQQQDLTRILNQTPKGSRQNPQRGKSPNFGTPPSIVRVQRVADLRMSVQSGLGASSSCSVSTLTMSSTNRSRQQPTRQATRSCDLESSSDEDNDFFVEANSCVHDLDNDAEDVDYDNNSTIDDMAEKSINDCTGRVADGSLSSFLDKLVFRYVPVAANQETFEARQQRPMYNGPEGLREGIAEAFTNPFECLSVCGGLDYDLVTRLAAASNDYFHMRIKPGLTKHNIWHHLQWTEITSEEMYHFLGILLQISITPMDSGGYKAYFSNNNQRISYRRGDEPVEISNSAGFAHNYMSIRRFMQIRGAFHPDDKALAAGGDKCYQIRYALNSFNEASKRTWFPPKDVTFDEGGVGCRSRYCPVRQYNKDKPQKYRVDFFIMAASKGYHILHLDVYQGKNQSNIGIASHLTDLPTTQKAVVNACQHLGFHKESAGMRHISMDNRYQCPQLAVLLRERFNCFST